MLEELERELEAQVLDLRRVTSALRPPDLDNRGLEAALQRHVEQFESEHHIAATSPSSGPPTTSPPRSSRCCTASPRRRCPTSASTPGPTTPR